MFIHNISQAAVQTAICLDPLTKGEVVYTMYSPVSYSILLVFRSLNKGGSCLYSGLSSEIQQQQLGLDPLIKGEVVYTRRSSRCMLHPLWCLDPLIKGEVVYTWGEFTPEIFQLGLDPLIKGEVVYTKKVEEILENYPHCLDPLIKGEVVYTFEVGEISLVDYPGLDPLIKGEVVYTPVSSALLLPVDSVV